MPQRNHLTNAGFQAKAEALADCNLDSEIHFLLKLRRVYPAYQYVNEHEYFNYAHLWKEIGIVETNPENAQEVRLIEALADQQTTE